MRDPRQTPKAGDEIKQAATGYHLKVISVDSDRVAWQRKKRGLWVDDNAWSLHGWRKIVARRAEIVLVAP
jgi:hypothetical protein